MIKYIYNFFNFHLEFFKYKNLLKKSIKKLFVEKKKI
jgi:hypothetical protein